MVFLLTRLIAYMYRRSDKPVVGEEFGFPQLLFRNHWADSCSILLALVHSLLNLRVSEARPNTLASWILPSTKRLTSCYRTSITLSLVHSRITIHT